MALRTVLKQVTKTGASLRLLHISAATSKVSPTWETTAPGWHFELTKEHGFMPTKPILRELPSQFEHVERLLQEMPIHKPDGSPGLLATGDFGAAVDKGLPLYDVSRVTDPVLLSALFRDYSFLAAAYVLEPCHISMTETGNFCAARPVLPESIAVPLDTLGQKLDNAPFLDYAHGYALNNSYKIDPNGGFTMDNMRTLRKFHGGDDEQGFILIHTAMVAHSGGLVTAGCNAVEAASKGDIDGLSDALEHHARTWAQLFNTFSGMWHASSPKGYLQFRTFIMGQKGNDDIFPEGTTFKGVSDEPRRFRGETGAQDSMVPATDNLLQIDYSHNKLTEYLWELRSYRPKDHRAYIKWLAEASREYKVRDLAMSRTITALGVLRNLDFIQQMRNQHWQMTRRYIIDNTKYPKATGGTPITTWLPNNLFSTLEYMQTVIHNIDSKVASDPLNASDVEAYADIKHRAMSRLSTLEKEVIDLQSDFDERQELEEFETRQH
eukprot:m.250431 g.250431  ORF g.250431 m.250431 type:complete len:494 (+) comp15435_c0_seq1:477-1958(+)